MTNKKDTDNGNTNASTSQNNANNMTMTVNDETRATVVPMPDFENIFHFDDEQKCWENQFIVDDEGNKVPYVREKPIEQNRWESFISKCVSPDSPPDKRLWFTSGEGTGIPKGKTFPRRIVTSIMRLRTTEGSEFLLSCGHIEAYNQFRDKQISPIVWPERWDKAVFKFETMPNRITGYAIRVNTGVSHSVVEYALLFNPENCQKLYDMRSPDIQFSVKDESKDRTIEVKKPQATLQENYELLLNSNFDYLFNSNYITTEDKLINMKKSEGDLLIAPQSDSDRIASIKAQESLSQKDKMSSYG